MRVWFVLCLILSLGLAPKAEAEWSFPALTGKKAHFKAASKGALQAPREMLLLVEHSCLRQRTDTLSSLLKHNTSQEISVEAVSLTVQNENDLQPWLHHPCVRAVSDNLAFHTSGVDPRLSEQPAWAPIRHAQAERLFFHPVFGIRQSVVVGVLDTGVQLDHPDLQTRLWQGTRGEIGYDFANNDADPSDDNGHGTHVAGLIGAQRANDIGLRGIMGESSLLMPVKTQGDDGSGVLANLVNGLRWATDHGADVINISIDGSDTNPILEDAIQYALARGVVLVAAAGNDGTEISSTHFVTPVAYASKYPGFIGVGAFDALSMLRPSFSNYGPRYVELSAPGSAGDTGILSTFTGSGYLAIKGTSMAAPQVSGAAALAVGFLRTQGEAYGPLDIERALSLSAVEDANLASSFAGGRRLDLEALALYLMRGTVISSSGGFDEDL